MRSYEEALSDVYARAEKEKGRRAVRAKRFRAVVVPAVSLCLVAAIGIGLIIRHAGRPGPGGTFTIPAGYASAWKGLNAVIVKWGQKSEEAYSFADDAGQSGYREVGIEVGTVFSGTMSGEDVEDMIKSASSIIMPDGSLPENGMTSLVFLDKLCGVRNVFEEATAPEAADLLTAEPTGFFVDPPSVDIIDGKLSFDSEAFESRYGGENYMPVMDYLTCANEYVEATGADVGLFGDGMSVESLQRYFEYLASAAEEEGTAAETGEPREGSILGIGVRIDNVFSIMNGVKYEILVDGEKIAASSVFRAYYGEVRVKDGEHTVTVRRGSSDMHPDAVQSVTVSGDTFVSFGLSYSGSRIIRAEIKDLVIRNADGGGGLIEVPNCTGMTYSEARALLEQSGFVNIYSDTPGVTVRDTSVAVVSMKPSPGSKADMLTWIHLAFSPVGDAFDEMLESFTGKSAVYIESVFPYDKYADICGSRDMLYFVNTDLFPDSRSAKDFNEYMKNAPDEEKEGWICEKASYNESSKYTVVTVVPSGLERLEQTFTKEDAIRVIELALTNQLCPDSLSGGEYETAKLRGADYDGIYRIRQLTPDPDVCYIPVSDNGWIVTGADFSLPGYPVHPGLGAAVVRWNGTDRYLLGDGLSQIAVPECRVTFDGKNYILSGFEPDLPANAGIPTPACALPLTSVPAGLVKGSGGVSAAGELEQAALEKLEEDQRRVDENRTVFERIYSLFLDLYYFNERIANEEDAGFAEGGETLIYLPGHIAAGRDGTVRAVKLDRERLIARYSLLFCDELVPGLMTSAPTGNFETDGEYYHISGYAHNAGDWYIGPDKDHVLPFGVINYREGFGTQLAADSVRIGDGTATVTFTLWCSSIADPGYDTENPAGTFDLTIKRTENGRWKISGGSFLDFIMPRQG